MPAFNFNVKLEHEFSDELKKFLLLLAQELRTETPRIIFKSVDYDSLIKPIGEIKMLELEVGQYADLSIAFLDRFGNPAPVQNVQWNVQDSSLATLSDVTDSSARIHSDRTNTGNTVVEVSADADLGDGVRNITGALLVAVNPPGARTVEISAGRPNDEDAPKSDDGGSAAA